MKDTEKLGVDLTLTRRQMLGSVGAAAGAATVLSMAPGLTYKPKWTN